MEEILQQIENAINNHALPRPYDYWLLAFTALSVILSFCAIFATIKIAKKQTAISEKQTEIMEQQNKIALFDKGNEFIQVVSEIRFFTTFIDVECCNKKAYECLETWSKIYNIDLTGSKVGICEGFGCGEPMATILTQRGQENYNKMLDLYRYQNSVLSSANLIFPNIIDDKITTVFNKYLDLINLLIQVSYYNGEECNVNSKINDFYYCIQDMLTPQFLSILKNEIKL